MSRFRVPVVVAALLAGAGAQSCTSESASRRAAPSVVASDSGGVRRFAADWEAVVEQADTLELAEPILRIGVAQGDPRYEFGEIVAVAALGESGVAVADSDLRTIRIYDVDGAFVSALGGPGEGPGELRSIRSIFQYRRDSLAVHDGTARRVTVFPLAGGAPRIIDARAEDGIQQVVGALADGRFVTRDGTTAGDGVQRGPARLLLHSPLGELEDSILTLDGDEMFNARSGGVRVLMRAPFQTSLFTVTAGDRLVIADGGQPGFDAYTLDGALVVRWRSDETREPVTPALIAAHRDSLLADNPMPERGGMAQAWEQAIRTMPYPDSLPLTTGMMADGAGAVWLGRDRPGQAPLWSVIAPDGRVLRLVRTPSNVALLAVTATRAYGVSTDELGLHYVYVYELPPG